MPFEPVGGDSNLYARFHLLPPSGSVSYTIHFSQPNQGVSLFADVSTQTNVAAAIMNLTQGLLDFLPLGGAPFLIIDNHQTIVDSFQQMPDLANAASDLFQSPPNLIGATADLLSWITNASERHAFFTLLVQLGLNISEEALSEFLGNPVSIIDALTTSSGIIRSVLSGQIAGSIIFIAQLRKPNGLAPRRSIPVMQLLRIA